jgi:hypothetical protein
LLYQLDEDFQELFKVKAFARREGASTDGREQREKV